MAGKNQEVVEEDEARDRKEKKKRSRACSTTVGESRYGDNKNEVKEGIGGNTNIKEGCKVTINLLTNFEEDCYEF